MSQRIGGILYGSWGLLGFYRGIQYYNFNHKKEMELYLKDPKIDKPQFFYINQIGVGGLGTLAYIMPLFCIFPAAKEIKRLEINLRGLEDEKTKPEYYNLF